MKETIAHIDCTSTVLPIIIGETTANPHCGLSVAPFLPLFLRSIELALGYEK